MFYINLLIYIKQRIKGLCIAICQLALSILANLYLSIEYLYLISLNYYIIIIFKLGSLNIKKTAAG